MMGRKGKNFAYVLIAVIFSIMMCACDPNIQQVPDRSAVETTPAPAKTEETTPTPEPEQNGELGETFIGDTNPAPEEEEEEGEPENTPSKDVDLIMFMGQSNMSGAAGDASLAPFVSEDAGMEFRAVSDPTTLYPIYEPFGINENNPTGLHEYPGAKKGSLVSAFINEYYKQTGRKVIAVSASMGATDTDTWASAGVAEDIRGRFDKALSYLKDNGYNVGHMYGVWLHGESDAIKGTAPDVYRTQLDNIMRPLFIDGMQKVFVITPGRTIDYKDIFVDIANMQRKICAESPYYALATTILSKVSAEYMRDQFHYNQHVLNLVGIESARAVAYYTEHNKEKIVYDYREGGYIVPEDVDEDSQEKDEPLHLSEINIDEVY